MCDLSCTVEVTLLEFALLSNTTARVAVSLPKAAKGKTDEHFFLSCAANVKLSAAATGLLGGVLHLGAKHSPWQFFFKFSKMQVSALFKVFGVCRRRWVVVQLSAVVLAGITQTDF